MDLDEHKHVLETTKVLGYREELRTSVSRGETRVMSSASGRAASQMQGDSETEGLSDGLTLSQAAYPTEEGGLFGLLPVARERIRHDNVGELGDDQFELTAQVNNSRGRSRATGRSRAQGVSESEIQGEAYGASYSETQTPTLVPELGKEVSSVTFRSLEEQRHRAMSSIQALKARTAWVRLVDSNEPRMLRTATIKPAFLGNERETAAALAGFASEALCKLPFAVRSSELQPAAPVAAVVEEPEVVSQFESISPSSP